MAYATWRHRFLRHKVLVHAEETALEAERAAMHTGRAEAWRHGVLNRGIWTEVDMRDAYIRIAAECSMPVKLKYNTGRLSNEQYATLRRDYRVLGKCMVANTVPVVLELNGHAAFCCNADVSITHVHFCPDSPVEHAVSPSFSTSSMHCRSLGFECCLFSVHKNLMP